MEKLKFKVCTCPRKRAWTRSSQFFQELWRCVGGTHTDLHRNSPTFSQWVSVHLSADNHKQLWVPPGFAHGFVVLSESAEFLYKTTDYWYAEHERSLLWNDSAIGIDWPIDFEPQLAAKDAAAKMLGQADLHE